MTENSPIPFALRILPIMWVVAFVIAMMPLKLYESHFLAVAFAVLMLAFIFQLLEARAAAVEVFLRQWEFSVFVAAFWVLALVSVVLSEARFISFLYFCFFSALPISFFLSVMAQQNTGFLRRVLMGLGGVFTLLGLTSLLQYFVVQDLLVSGRVAWPITNPNILAGLLSLGFFGALGVMLSASDKRGANFGLGLAILLLCALMTTLSKGAIIAGAVGVAVFLFLVRAQIKNHWRCLLSVGVSAIIFAALMHVFAKGDVQTPGHVIEATAESFGTALNARPEIWASAWHIIQEHFWTGTGIGTFFLYYPEYRGDDFQTAGIMAHSDPLQFWVEMGVLAPLLFYGLIAFSIFKVLRALKNLPKDDPRYVKIAAAFCAFGALALHTHITFHFYLLPILILSGLMLGYLVVQIDAVEGKSAKALSVPAVPYMKYAFVAVFMLQLLVFSFGITSNIFVESGRRAMMQGDVKTFGKHINIAGDLSMRKNARALLLASTFPLGILEANAAQLSQQKKQELYEQTYGLLDRAEALNPRLSAIYVYKADLEKIDAPFLPSKETSEALYLKALKVDPFNLSARQGLAKIYMEQNRNSKAYEVLKSGLKWPYFKQSPAAYYQQTALLAVSLEDVETHKVAMEKLREIQKIAQNVVRKQKASPLIRFIKGVSEPAEP